MEEWKSYKLSEIGTVVGGATPSTKVPENYDGEISWITPKDLSNFAGRYIFRGERNITQRGYNSCSCQLLPKGTVLFSSRAPIGYVAIAGKEMCTNQGFKSIIPNSKIVDYRFLYYLLKFNKNRIADLGSGTTFMEISGSVMRNVEISLPNLSTQKRIAEVLCSIDDKIELNNRINHNLEEQAKAMYKSWFVDFEPFKDGTFVDSELGLIPKGWRVGTIYDICDVYYGAPFNSTLFNSERKGSPLIRIRDLAKQEAGVFTEERHPKGQLTCKGDILVGMDGEFSIYIWGGEDSWINQRISRFSPKPGISHYYLTETLRPQLKAVESSEVATTVIHIGKNDYDKFLAIIPPQSVMDSFYRVSEPLYLQYVDNLSGNQELSESRDVLLPRLMSGLLTC